MIQFCLILNTWIFEDIVSLLSQKITLLEEEDETGKGDNLQTCNSYLWEKLDCKEKYDWKTSRLYSK